jgi:hypothetical protein
VFEIPADQFDHDGVVEKRDFCSGVIDAKTGQCIQQPLAVFCIQRPVRIGGHLDHDAQTGKAFADKIRKLRS